MYSEIGPVKSYDDSIPFFFFNLSLYFDFKILDEFSIQVYHIPK